MVRYAPAARRWAYLVLTFSVVLAGCRTGLPAASKVRDARLRRPDLFVYPTPASAGPAKGLIFFFGNDVGFWEPHRRLAMRLSHAGYAFVGLDVRDYLSHLPASEPQRDSVFADSISPLIAQVRHDFGDSLPFILGGHSFGAEVALWLAQHHEPVGLSGVLAMSPRARGHLFVTPMDWANLEPHGSDAWSTIEAAREIDPRVRIALVRGSKDRFAGHDAAFVAVGGARLRRYVIPFAGHTLKRLLLAGPIIEHAVNYLAAADASRSVIARH